MNFSIEDIKKDAILYFKGDPKRVHHLLKVHSFGKLIAQSINLGEHDLFILEITLLLHDVGIKKGELLHSSSAGIYQEKYGPDCAREILKKYNLDEIDLAHISYMIAHHHSYKEISDISLQILVEADFLVNAYEDNMNKDIIKNVYNKVFKNKLAKVLLESIYLQN